MWFFPSCCQTVANVPKVTEVTRALLFQRTGFMQIFRLNTVVGPCTLFLPTHAVSPGSPDE